MLDSHYKVSSKANETALFLIQDNDKSINPLLLEKIVMAALTNACETKKEEI